MCISSISSGSFQLIWRYCDVYSKLCLATTIWVFLLNCRGESKTQRDVGWTGHDKNHILAFYQIFSSKVFKHTFTGNEGKVWLWEKSVEFGWRLLNFTRFKPKLNFSVLSNISIHQHSVATRLRKMKQIKKRMNCRSCTMVHPQRVGNHNIF